MFAALADNLVKAADLVAEMFAPGSDRQGLANRMRDLEHACDASTHQIMRHLNSTFVTPFDREDIYELAGRLDDVMDFMDAAVDLVVLYSVDELPRELASQAEVLQRMAALTASAMPRLRTMKDLSEYWIEVNRLENEADKVYRRLVARLFNGDTEALAVLKLKDIVDQLEYAADAFEKVANTVGAIAWNLITWYFGLPSSSSHALIGGLIGAALVSGGTVKWGAVKEKVLIPMVTSPIAGFVLSFVFMLALLWLFRRMRPSRANRGFRGAQGFSSAAMAYGHGLQDAQKTMGVITLTLVVSGHLGENEGIPLWVKLSAATAISLGTISGGARIMRTLGRRVIKMDPAQGFAAQTVASSVLFYTAAQGFPVSTTHVISTSVMGVGATRR